ncbi:MAG: hypothetical protein IPI04_19360 [Ignavibacteria bacterium]|nr:hypothetical protein [Ignavibacteria bacterium]
MSIGLASEASMYPSPSTSPLMIQYFDPFSLRLFPNACEAEEVKLYVEVSV